MRKAIIALAGAALLGTVFAPAATADKQEENSGHHGMPEAPSATDFVAGCAVTGQVGITPGVSAVNQSHNRFVFSDVAIQCLGNGVDNQDYTGTYETTASGDTDGLGVVAGAKGPHGEDLTQGWSDVGTISVTSGPSTGDGVVKFIRGYEQAEGMNIRTGNGGDVKAWGTLDLAGAATGLHCFVVNLGIEPLGVSDNNGDTVITQGLLEGDAQIYLPGNYTVDKTGAAGAAGTCFSAGTKKDIDPA